MNKASITAFVWDLLLNPAAREALQENVNALQASLPPNPHNSRGALPLLLDLELVQALVPC